MSGGKRAERPAGRRVARPTRPERSTWSWLGPRWLFVVAAAVIAGLITMIPSQTEQQDREPLAVPVQTTSYACPLTQGTEMIAGQVNPGETATAVSVPDGDPINELTDANVWRTTTENPPAVLVHQEGEGAGAVGFVSGVAAERLGEGLVTAQCPGLLDEAWFIGMGSADRHFSHIELVNLGEDRAIVDFELWSPNGKLEAANAAGIVIEPGERQRLALQDLAAGENNMAVQVVRRRGMVAALALDTATGDDLQGTEWQSPAPAAAELLHLAGVSDFTDRQLLVVNPGESTAHFTASVISAEGTFVAEGLDDVAVEPRSVRVIEVPDSINLAESTVRIEADHPVNAALRVKNGNDFSYATSVAPLSGPAVVPITEQSPQVTVTAIDEPTTVTVELFDGEMNALGSVEYELRDGSSVTFSPDEIAAGGVYAVIDSPGALVGAAVFRDGDAVASMGLSGAPIENLAPQLELR